MNIFNKDLFKLQEEFAHNGSIRWESPSNIALVKYWGKKNEQEPENASISFSLSKSRTLTKLSWVKKDIEDIDKQNVSFKFEFHGEKKNEFNPKIQKFLNRFAKDFSFIKKFDFKIESENTFPHSTGIASSASAMSALALCFCDFVSKASGADLTQEDFCSFSSFYSRIGSGSACRSIYPGFCIWGENKALDSTNFVAREVENIHEKFKELQDSILIISSDKKVLSSSMGHGLMDEHPFREARYENANKNINSLLIALSTGDFDIFGNILEREALELHGLMFNSSEPFILMEPNTIAAIKSIWEFRKKTSLPVFFTLDAGPNIHLIYPKNIKDEVQNFIKSELVNFCENEKWIDDCIGSGPQRK